MTVLGAMSLLLLSSVLLMRTLKLGDLTCEAPGLRARLRSGAGKCWWEAREKHAALHSGSLLLSALGTLAIPNPKGTQQQNLEWG